ncbi:hypothetical protein THARTR1_10627 [Trichoderma harzianum]|uniref:Uncharacterized protein n=1 Tax=Trichoderma harzianum TaxID=5544 RepID=A0A2K0TNL7_TRIHA|nr:hypothetical protein THARTR1_10627 [Trichoderma harzianum]
MAVRRMVFAVALAGGAAALAISKPTKPTSTTCGIICISALLRSLCRPGSYASSLPASRLGESNSAESGCVTPTVESPSSVTPASETPDSETPDSEAPDSETPDSEAPDSETPDSESPISGDPIPAEPVTEVEDVPQVGMELGSTPENPLPWIPDENDDIWW